MIGMGSLKNQKILLCKEFLIVQMNHWVLFSIAATIQGLVTEGRPDLLSWGLCSLFPYLLFLVRQSSNKILPFVTMHILLAVGMILFLPAEGVEGILFFAYLAGYVVYSLFLRLQLQTKHRLDKAMVPPVAVGIVAVMFLLQHALGQKEWDGYYVFSLTVFVGMYFIYYFIERYQHFLEINEDSAGPMPEREMFRSGMGLAVIYTVFSVAVMLLTANIGWLSRMMVWLRQGLVGLIRWLVQLLGNGDGEPIENWTTVPEQMQPFMEAVEPEETFWLWELLDKIFMAAFFCFLLVMAVWGLIRLIRFLQERFGRKLKKQEAGLAGSGDIREKCEIVRKKSERKAFFSFLTPGERIRRIYKKRVLEGKELLIGGEEDSGRLNTFTAGECGRLLGAGRMTGIYEKARYSEEKCTAEDVREAKTS